MRADDGARRFSTGSRLTPEVEKFLAPRALPPMGDSVVCGIKAGIAGSVAAFIFLSILYAMNGGDLTLPSRILAFRLSGNVVVASGSLGVGLSISVIMAAGAAFGALFGVIMSRLIGRAGWFVAAGVGMTYGVLIWIVTQYVVLSYLAPDVLMLYDQRALMWSYVAYGAGLGIFGDAYR